MGWLHRQAGEGDRCAPAVKTRICSSGSLTQMLCGDDLFLRSANNVGTLYMVRLAGRPLSIRGAGKCFFFSGAILVWLLLSPGAPFYRL